MSSEASSSLPQARMTLAQALDRLDQLAPAAPLLALGQTPLWDEPMKAIVAAAGRRPMIAGIHDLDYFSRIRVIAPGPPWQIIPRNDGTWRDAWVAAGEISALFGAEVWPTRQALADAGVHLDRIVPPGRSRQEALDRLTAAWGWRGIIRNSLQPPVLCDVSASEIFPVLRDLLRWACRQTARILPRPEDRKNVSAFVRRIEGWSTEYLQNHPSAALPELYTELLRRLYETLVGRLPSNLTFCNARELLIFNRNTAGLPRFAFVNQFLDPRLAPCARAAYDKAVAGSAIAALEAAGPDALPFEIYVPGRGRGTLHISQRSLRIDLTPPLEVPLSGPIGEVAELAEILERNLGPRIALLGKAIALPAMLAAEFAMVMHETGSVYLPRTQLMLREMENPPLLNPMLRVRLSTWDALAACGTMFRLPEHLAQAFGRQQLTAVEFAREWKSAVGGQERLLRELKAFANLCEFVRCLGHDEHDRWFARLEQCNRANAILLEVQKRADALRHKALDLRAKEDETAAEVRVLEERRGVISRDRIRPLRRQLAELAQSAPRAERERLQTELKAAEEQGRALLLALEAKQKEHRSLRERRAQIGRRLRALERSGKAAAARRLLASVQRAADRARLRLACNAILSSRALPHAELRPSAWWMPALDPSGSWFEEIRRTARFRLEPLVGENY